VLLKLDCYFLYIVLTYLQISKGEVELIKSWFL